MPNIPEVEPKRLPALLCDVNSGIIRIPDFQRTLVWNSDQILELLDSIKRGYPIGSFLIWKTTERLAERNPANLQLGTPIENSEIQYLLDGQQRLINLYTIFKNKLEIGLNKIRYRVYYSLTKKEFEFVKKSDNNRITELSSKLDVILLDEMIQFDWSTRSFNLSRSVVSRIKRLENFENLFESLHDLYDRIIQVSIPTVVVSQSLRVACTIFERTNTTGSDLTIVDLMVAKTYNNHFNLRTELENLKNTLEDGMFAIDDKTILQCFSACLSEGISRTSILGSAKSLEGNWNILIKSFLSAIDFIKNYLGIPSSKFLPYEIILAPFTYYFFERPNFDLDQLTIKKLKKYFWLIGLSDYYIEGQNSKVKTHIQEIRKLRENSESEVFNNPVEIDISKISIKNTKFDYGSAFCKTVLCVLANKTPLNFVNNQPINLGTNFLELNNKSLHHIFPKDFIKTNLSRKENYEKEIKPFMEGLANISLIPISQNRNISNKAPSVYFREFENVNPNIERSLESHLIGDFDEFGISKDDFVKFVEKRSELISQNLSSIIRDFEINVVNMGDLQNFR